MFLTTLIFSAGAVQPTAIFLQLLTGQITDRFNDEQGNSDVRVCVSGGGEELGVPDTRGSNCIIQIN